MPNQNRDSQGQFKEGNEAARNKAGQGQQQNQNRDRQQSQNQRGASSRQSRAE